MAADFTARLKELEIPGQVTLLEGNGELPKFEVVTPNSSAEIYLHGAHLTHFQKKGEEPLLFLSKFSRFAQNHPIRGGIPFVFPWFGPREGEPMHGFARLTNWELAQTCKSAEQAITLRFTLPECAEGASFPPFTAEYRITVAETLILETFIRNVSPDADFTFEVAFHTYFAVGDVRNMRITGLQGAAYLDKVDNFAQKTQTEEAIQVSSETDRVYPNTPGQVEIHDLSQGRIIGIAKSGAESTVVWNPWMTKAQQMPDFGTDEYLKMVCVESGNIAANKITLPPGQTSTTRVELSSRPLP